jgi:hypothetical protein
MDDDKKTPCPSGDELQAGPDLGNGMRPFIRHTADHKIVAGVMSPVREGQPLMPGAFNLEPIAGTDRFTVEDLPSMPVPQMAAPPPSKGPAMVTTKAYRSGWDNVFGQKQVVGEA